MNKVRTVRRWIADAKKKNRAFEQALKTAGIVIPRGALRRTTLES